MKKQYSDLLLSTNRIGVDNLLRWLEEKGFFTAPASTKFHGSFEGGLLQHSLNVYKTFAEQHVILFHNGKGNENHKPLSQESIILVSLLHDCNKIGLYYKTGNEWRYNTTVGNQGHAILSLRIIKQFIQLTEIEEILIKYHMGIYYSKESNARNGEYSLKELINIYNEIPLAKLFHFCDDIAAQFIDK